MIDLMHVLEEVKRVAYDVGSYQKNMIDSGFEVDLKSNDIDFVTEVDKTSENIILERVLDLVQGSGFLAEESGLQTNDSDYIWVIDPLDGTTNYVNGFPIYTVAIGLKYKGEVVLGVVYSPELDYMFSAIKGEGAYLNDKRIVVSKKDTLDGAFLASGFPYSKKTDDRFITYFASTITKLSGFRRSGSAAFDLCLIAKGVFDVYYEVSISEWDYSAASIIVREAGGELLQYKNYEKGKDFIIAGNEKIMSEIIDVFQIIEL